MLAVLVLAAAFIVQPRQSVPMQPSPRLVRCASVIAAQEDSDDAAENIDWDKEAAALVARGSAEKNRFYQAIKAISTPELVSEFAKTAPKDVQIAVKATVGQLLGNLPSEVMQSEVQTSGKNLGSLLFSMQMTGYMFRNAEYRRSLSVSLEGKASLEGSTSEETAALPPISGTISVKIAEGMEAEVDAAAYMSELRGEVEALRSELIAAKQKEAEADPAGGLIRYIQSLSAKDAESLQKDVSRDILEAMSQLVSSLMIDLNIPYADDVGISASADKLRELLITQLVAGYKLRELEARDDSECNPWLETHGERMRRLRPQRSLESRRAVQTKFWS